MVGQISQSQSQQAGQSAQQSLSQQAATSFIPDYSQTPILEQIAKYASSMAPVVYQWGMDQFNRNQGNIDNLMRTAQMYASPQRVAAEMGMAQAGVMQAGEQGRQAAVRDLESYGIDPSSGRYAALDSANRVMTAAAAAGAGNQQRMATEAAGSAMQQQALSASLQNTQLGYGAAGAMTGLLGTGMQLKYSPLGQTSQGVSSSTGQSTSGGWSWSQSNPDTTGVMGGTATGMTNPMQTRWAKGGLVDRIEPTQGGFVSNELSPSGGDHTDDVNARLNAGEFVIPKDIVQWKGKEFFAKLIAQARKQRAMDGSGQQQEQEQEQPTGYVGGGMVTTPGKHIPARWDTPPRAQNYSGDTVDIDLFNLMANGVATGRFAKKGYQQGGFVQSGQPMPGPPTGPPAGAQWGPPGGWQPPPNLVSGQPQAWGEPPGGWRTPPNWTPPTMTPPASAPTQTQLPAVTVPSRGTVVRPPDWWQGTPPQITSTTTAR